MLFSIAPHLSASHLDRLGFTRNELHSGVRDKTAARFIACISMAVNPVQDKAWQADIDAFRLAIDLIKVDFDQGPNTSGIFRLLLKGCDLALSDLYRLAQLQQGLDVAGDGLIFKNYNGDIHF